jgi:hypothetical protein
MQVKWAVSQYRWALQRKKRATKMFHYGTLVVVKQERPPYKKKGEE